MLDPGDDDDASFSFSSATIERRRGVLRSCSCSCSVEESVVDRPPRSSRSVPPTSRMGEGESKLLVVVVEEDMDIPLLFSDAETDVPEVDPIDACRS